MSAAPDRLTVIEPSSTRSVIEWTPGLITAARSNADAGILALAADFCESAMNDDRVSAALATRTNGLVSLPISFEAARGKKRLVKALEAGEDWWSAYPATALAQLLRWGIILGVGLGQHVWTDRGASINRLVPKLKVWNPRHLRWDWQKRRWMLRVDGDKEIEVTPGDGTWVLYTPYGDSRPWAHGAWRAIALWHLLKQYAISDWARYSERHGQGTTVVESAENTSKEKRKELSEQLYNLGRESVLVLPAGFDYRLVEAVANTWETFQAQKNAADLGMAVAITGQNLSTEVSGPVSTGATLHGRVLQMFIDADAETLTTCVHDQSLVWWAEFNFGSRDDAPWPIYDTKPPEDRKANADILKIVSDALNTMSNANAPVDVRALLERYGVPLKDPKDVEQSGQVFKYHLDYGVLTLNEIRERLGLPEVKGGEVPPKPAAKPGGTEDDDKDDTDADGEKALTPADVVRLRSGRAVPASSGIVQGQLYADRVADHARERAAKVLDGDLVAVLEAVEAGESYEDIRKRLVKTFKGMSPDDLARLTEAAITMAELGGRHAVNEDA